MDVQKKVNYFYKRTPLKENLYTNILEVNDTM